VIPRQDNNNNINTNNNDNNNNSNNNTAIDQSNSNQFLPESFHTARSFKNSPTTNELQFSSSVNSINSNFNYNNSIGIVPNINNNSITNNISNLRNPFNSSSSPGPNFSPRAEPPSTNNYINNNSNNAYFNRERSSLSDAVNNNAFLRNNVSSQTNSTSSSITRPSLLTSKLAASSNSMNQLPTLQQSHSHSQSQVPLYQPHDSPSYQPYPNPKTASFRNSFLKSGNNQNFNHHYKDNNTNTNTTSSSLSSSINNELPNFSFPNRSSNINIQSQSMQPSTSQHFKHSEVVNSFTPFHNTPSVVSSSYSSAPNSIPNQFHSIPKYQQNYIPQSQSHSSNSSFSHNFPQPGASIPTTTVSTESALPNEFSRPSQITRSSTTTTTTTTREIPFEEPKEPNLKAEDEDEDEDDSMDHDAIDEGEDQGQDQDQDQDQDQPPAYSEPLFSSSLSDSSSLLQNPSTSNESQHLDILNHPVNDLLLMLSALLQKIVEANDNLHPHHYNHASQLHQSNKFTANVLAFHGRNVPAISLHAYLSRILKYCPVTNEVFLTLLVYFDRIAKRANSGEFDQINKSSNENRIENGIVQNSEEDQQLFVMDSYNIHRLIIAGITVASKFFSDIFYKNSRYAKVGGLPLDELNHLELQFLLLTDFKLMIQIEELQRYADLLLKFWKREQNKNQNGDGDGDDNDNNNGDNNNHNNNTDVGSGETARQ